jgi:kinesin family protein C1
VGEPASKQNQQTSQFKMMFSNCSECLFFVVISLVCTVLFYKCFGLCGLLDGFVDKLEREEAEREEIAKFLSEEKTRILAALESVRQRKEQGQRNRSRAEAIKLQIAQSREEVSRLKTRIVELDEKILKKELERRRKHDEWMNRRGNIRVFCRVRPSKGKEEDDVVKVNSKLSSLSIVTNNSKQMTTTDYKFDKVYAPSASQENVFQDIELLVQSALDGKNVCIFAYGQTGSGKSFTMEGPSEQQKRDSSFYGEHPARGVIPRAVRKIFDSITRFAEMGWSYSLKCSFFEVYQKDVFDLSTAKAIQISDTGDRVNLRGLEVHAVNSVEQVDELLIRAKKNRKVGSTAMNARSSRSHFIFQLLIEGTHVSGRKCCGTLSLVDLAGSENIESLKNKKQVDECKEILSSLGALKTALTRLREGKTPTFRDSKLTHVLKNSLTAGSKVLMFVNVAPEKSCLQETKSSLNFGKSVNAIKLGSGKSK